MKPTTNLKQNLPAASKKEVPPFGSLDYYIYARNFPKISEYLTPTGDLKDFDRKLLELLDKTIFDLGHLKAHLSPEHKRVLLSRLRTETFNYFPNHTMEEMKLCFNNGVRDKYGVVTHLSISTIHKWFDGFKKDEDRKLAIQSEEAKIRMLKAELERKQKAEPKLRFMHLHMGLKSLLDSFYGSSDAGKTAWVYYDEFRLLKMLYVPKDTWEAYFPKAKEFEMEVSKAQGGQGFKKAIEDIQSPGSSRVESTTKRMLLEKYIHDCHQQNYCIMTAFETANAEEFYKLEHPEPNLEFWKYFMNEMTIGAYQAFLDNKSIRGMHAAIYNFLKKEGHLEKMVDDQEKTRAINQAQEDVYEHYSKFFRKDKSPIVDGIMERIKKDPANCSEVRYEAKYQLLKLFFGKIHIQNINLETFLGYVKQHAPAKTDDDASQDEGNIGKN
jgi:hypothetical protein